MKTPTLFIHLASGKWGGVKMPYNRIGPVIKMFREKFGATGWAFEDGGDLRNTYPSVKPSDIIFLD